MAKEELVEEWLKKGQRDIEDAEFLLSNNRALELKNDHQSRH